MKPIANMTTEEIEAELNDLGCAGQFGSRTERERLSEEKHDVFESGRRQGRRDVFQGVGRDVH